MFLTEFVNKLHLTSEDRAALRKKRGFNDDTIDVLRFKSLGPYVEGVVKSLDRKLCQEFKLVDATGAVNYQLLKPNVLIPYLDADGNAYKIRPHKMGLPDDPIKIYCDKLITSAIGDTLVITEGEFKAAALFQLGIPCVAVPGISSYVKTRLPELVEFMKATAFANIIILFDREIKDNPKFESYKPDVTKRHDTAIYSYLMAKALKDASMPFDVRIGELPESWMIQGKADLDGALAQGKSVDEFKAVIGEAQGLEKFLDQYTARLDKDVGTFVRRKIIRFNQNEFIGVRRNFNKYQVRRKDDWVDVSNFVMDIVGRYYDPELNQQVRQIVIQTETGLKIGPIILVPESLSGASKFKTFMLGLGDLVFSGVDADITKIITFEFNRIIVDKKITLINHCGKIDSGLVDGHDVWIFEKVALIDGVIVSPDQDGIFWLDDNTGIRNKEIHGIKYPKIEMSAVDLKQVHDRFIDLSGNNGRILLGWAVYCLLSSYIKADDINPFPFLYGERGSGKTSVCKCLMGLFGLFDFGSQINDITNVALTRLLAFYSEIPLWLDEFHNTKTVETKEPFLKSVYNKQAVFRGTKQADQLIAYSIRSKLLLSGETVPKTDGVRSRSVLMSSSIQGPQGKDALTWFQANRDKLGGFTLEILGRKAKLAEAIAERIPSIKAKITDKNAATDERTLRHLSFFVASYECVFGENPLFFAWILDEFIVRSKEFVDNDEIDKLFEGFSVLCEQGRIEIGSFLRVDGPEIMFWFSGFFDVYTKEYLGRIDVTNKNVILETIRKRSYFLRLDNRRVNKVMRRCVVFDYESAPFAIKALADYQESLNEGLHDVEPKNDIPF